MALQKREICLRGAGSVAGFFAKESAVDECGIVVGLECQGAIEPHRGVIRLIRSVECERVVICGASAQRRGLVGVELRELGGRAAVFAEANEGDAAIEMRFAERRLQRDGRVETGERFLRVAAEQDRDAAQIFALGRRGAAALRAVELLQRARILAVEQVVNGAVAAWIRLRDERCRNQCDQCEPLQAAPRTCSSMTMSPRFTACTNPSTTCGSKRVPAKLLIFSTT